MATLDSIAEGALLEQETCSLYEFAAHLFIREAYSADEVLASVIQNAPELSNGPDICTLVERVNRLVKVRESFRRIVNISEMSKYGKIELRPLITVVNGIERKNYMGEEDALHWTILASASSDPGREVELRNGMIALAAIKWYLVRVRELLGSVGEDRKEVDRFWQQFGEYHHVDIVQTRDALVHAGVNDLEPPKLIEFVDWLELLAEKIRRTSFAVPDKDGMVASMFRTAEMAKLSKIGNELVSAANALVNLTVETDLTSDNPLGFWFISFDPDTRQLQSHTGSFGMVALIK